MESARFIVTHIWNSAGKSLKKEEPNPKKLIPLPWDKEEITKQPQSMDEMKQVMFGLAALQKAKSKHNPVKNKKG